MRIQLNGDVVFDIYRSCLAKPDEDQSSGVTRTVQGLSSSAVKFNLARLEAHRQEIHELVSQLPEEFSSQTGASIEKANFDRRGELWNGASTPMCPEQLVQLGCAIGEVRFLGHRRESSSQENAVLFIAVRQ